MRPGDLLKLDVEEPTHQLGYFIGWDAEDAIIVESVSTKERFYTHYKSVIAINTKPIEGDFSDAQDPC